MQLSVIIVNYNVEQWLHLCLNSVVAATQSLNAQIIVVDNASSDGSCAMVRKYFPEATLVSNSENVGFSKANNQGVALATGTYVCILNPDTIVPENCFENIYAFAKAKLDVGIIGPRLIDGKGCFLPESKRNVPTPSIALQKILGLNSRYYATKIDEAAIDTVPILVGAFMFLKRSIYLEVGGFDERYFMYGEDIDFSYSVLQKGYVNYYYGTKAVVHFKGESTVKNTQYRARFYGAMQLFFEKYWLKNRLQKFAVQSILYVIKTCKVGFTKSEASTPKVSKIYTLGVSEIMQSKIAAHFDREVTPLKNTDIQAVNTIFYIDMVNFTYSKLITFMQSNAHKKCSYRIITENSIFAVGSDFSDKQGVVEKLI